MSDKNTATKKVKWTEKILKEKGKDQDLEKLREEFGLKLQRSSEDLNTKKKKVKKEKKNYNKKPEPFFQSLKKIFKENLLSSVDCFRNSWIVLRFTGMGLSGKMLVLLFLTLPAIFGGFLALIIALVVFLLWVLVILCRSVVYELDKVSDQLKETIKKYRRNIEANKYTRPWYKRTINVVKMTIAIMATGAMFAVVSGVKIPIKSIDRAFKNIGNIINKVGKILKTTAKAPSEIRLNRFEKQVQVQQSLKAGKEPRGKKSLKMREISFQKKRERLKPGKERGKSSVKNVKGAKKEEGRREVVSAKKDSIEKRAPGEKKNFKGSEKFTQKGIKKDTKGKSGERSREGELLAKKVGKSFVVQGKSDLGKMKDIEQSAVKSIGAESIKPQREAERVKEKIKIVEKIKEPKMPGIRSSEKKYKKSLGLDGAEILKEVIKAVGETAEVTGKAVEAVVEDVKEVAEVIVENVKETTEDITKEVEQITGADLLGGTLLKEEGGKKASFDKRPPEDWGELQNKLPPEIWEESQETKQSPSVVDFESIDISQYDQKGPVVIEERPHDGIITEERDYGSLDASNFQNKVPKADRKKVEVVDFDSIDDTKLQHEMILAGIKEKEEKMLMEATKGKGERSTHADMLEESRKNGQGKNRGMERSLSNNNPYKK